MWILERIIAGLQQINLGWRDIIDILIITVIFYRLILLIKGTRAEQLVKGLVLLLLATVFSDKLGLNTLNWILRQAMTVGLIAIPIVFQPELRRALEQLGRGKIFQRSPWGPKEFDHFLNEIVKAIPVLVKKRFGALIVVEMETGLKEYIETGISVEGTISAELLINIFFPRSPLHDGAVIIRGNQVVAAGCYLPLTERPNLSKELGTRHRAAIGVTEETDAVVIIVSEETGVVSLAYAGRLTRYLDEKSLRNLLEELCAPRSINGNNNIWPWRFS